MLMLAACGGSSSDDGSRKSKDEDRSSKQSSDAQDEGPSEDALRETFEANAENLADHDFDAACDSYTEQYWDASLKEARASGFKLDTDDCERGIAGMVALAEGFGLSLIHI